MMNDSILTQSLLHNKVIHGSSLLIFRNPNARAETVFISHTVFGESIYVNKKHARSFRVMMSVGIFFEQYTRLMMCTEEKEAGR